MSHPDEDYMVIEGVTCRSEIVWSESVSDGTFRPSFGLWLRNESWMKYSTEWGRQCSWRSRENRFPEISGKLIAITRRFERYLTRFGALVTWPTDNGGGFGSELMQYLGSLFLYRPLSCSLIGNEWKKRRSWQFKRKRLMSNVPDGNLVKVEPFQIESLSSQIETLPSWIKTLPNCNTAKLEPY